MDNGSHLPVLLGEVLDSLAPVAGSRFVDATFGGGGYSLALLDRNASEVVALDRDPAAIARGHDLAAERPRLRLIETSFGDLGNAVDGSVDGVVFDLGVSSFQLDAPERGFAFRYDGPLDMRMGRAGPTAADLVNDLAEAELVRVLRQFGEEPQARRIARAVVARRRERPFHSTADLADLVRSVLRRPPGRGIDPATRTFQALRIAVNDELGELERGLDAALGVLAPGGRLVVVSFHSLEDRIVKRFFRDAAGQRASVSRHQPLPETAAAPLLELRSKKVVRPSAVEVDTNPRARSARLRWAVRTEAPR